MLIQLIPFIRLRNPTVSVLQIGYYYFITFLFDISTTICNDKNISLHYILAASRYVHKHIITTLSSVTDKYQSIILW